MLVSRALTPVPLIVFRALLCPPKHWPATCMTNNPLQSLGRYVRGRTLLKERSRRSMTRARAAWWQW
jgi:hypothetical protein